MGRQGGRKAGGPEVSELRGGGGGGEGPGVEGAVVGGGGGGPPLGCAEWMNEEEAGEGMKLERCRKRLSQSQYKQTCEQ